MNRWKLALVRPVIRLALTLLIGMSGVSGAAPGTLAHNSNSQPAQPADRVDPREAVRREPPAPDEPTGETESEPAESVSSDVDESIVFDPAVVDFGRVLAGSVVSQEIWVINLSETPLTIVETRSTCGCTVTRLVEREIPPGDAIQARVQLTVQSRGTAIHKQVRFRFAQGQPDRLLTVKATAVQPITLVPDHVPVENIAATPVVVESTEGVPFRVLGANPAILAPWVDAQAATSHELRIDAILWHASGQPSRIELILDHGEVPTISLPIRSTSSASARGSRAGQSMRQPRVVIAPPPRLALSDDRLRFGEVASASPGQLRLTVVGSFAPDVQPEIAMESAMAEMSLIDVEHTSDGIQLTLRLTSKPEGRGYVRSPLTIRIGSTRGWCEVFASINRP